MNIKLQAAIDIAKMVAIIIAIEAAIILAVNVFGIMNVLIFGGIVAGIFCFYQLYQIRVGQLEYREKLNEMTKDNPTLK